MSIPFPLWQNLLLAEIRGYHIACILFFKKTSKFNILRKLVRIVIPGHYREIPGRKISWDGLVAGFSNLLTQRAAGVESIFWAKCRGRKK
jgi:hypothetical protein